MIGLGLSIARYRVGASGGASGVLTDGGALAQPGSLNLTTVGTTDWFWMINSNSVVRRKSGSTATSTIINGASTFSGFMGTNWTISNGDGTGFDVADTNNTAQGINMPAASSVETGLAISGLTIGNTTRTVDLYFQVNSGTATVLATLSDSSATLAGISVSPGGNSGRRFTVRGGVGSTLTLKVSTLGDSQGGSFIQGLTVAVY